MFIVVFLLSLSVSAQTPTHYPTGDDPVDITLVNILVYFVTPFLLVIIYLWWRNYRRKMEEKEKNSNSGT